MKALFDTNILVDYLNGAEQARHELALYETPLISLVTWMEVLVGAADEQEDRLLRGFLTRFGEVPVDKPVSERAVEIRRRHRMRLPDAIIWASAQQHDVLLVTRNTKDFPETAPGIRVPYRL